MKTIEVVAAIIRKEDRIFATQRGYGDFKDWWEFPGGKMEPGETPEDALVREIKEELSTDISVDKFLYTVDYDYPKFHLTMHCYMCSLLNEALHLNEHEAARWLSVNEFDTVNWLPADKILLVYIERELGVFKGIKNPPKFKTGDTIYWFCDDDQTVHHAQVQMVHYALMGHYLEDVNYEVMDECNGHAVTRFIDDNDAQDKDYS